MQLLQLPRPSRPRSRLLLPRPSAQPSLIKRQARLMPRLKPMLASLRWLRRSFPLWAAIRTSLLSWWTPSATMVSGLSPGTSTTLTSGTVVQSLSIWRLLAATKILAIGSKLPTLPLQIVPPVARSPQPKILSFATSSASSGSSSRPRFPPTGKSAETNLLRLALLCATASLANGT